MHFWAPYGIKALILYKIHFTDAFLKKNKKCLQYVN